MGSRLRYAQAKFPKAVPFLDEALGIGYLHQAEMENDIYHNPGDRCLFPDAAGHALCADGQFREGRPAFPEVPGGAPDDIEARWLLNVAEMTLGNYPDRVPRPISDRAVAISPPPKAWAALPTWRRKPA